MDMKNLEPDEISHKFSEGISNLLKPLVEGLEGSIGGVLSSQENLETQINLLISELSKIESSKGTMNIESQIARLVKIREKVIHLKHNVKSVQERSDILLMKIEKQKRDFHNSP
eukprot:Sdes_comp17228_c0_seq1m6414